MRGRSSYTSVLLLLSWRHEMHSIKICWLNFEARSSLLWLVSTTTQRWSNAPVRLMMNRFLWHKQFESYTQGARLLTVIYYSTINLVKMSRPISFKFTTSFVILRKASVQYQRKPLSNPKLLHVETCWPPVSTTEKMTLDVSRTAMGLHFDQVLMRNH